MRAFKTKAFKKWANDLHLSDDALLQSIKEIEQGNIDANLGGSLYKQRVPLDGGKRSGVRIILALKSQEKTFFLYGFKKNRQDNLTPVEQKVYKILAKAMLALSNKEIADRLRSNVLFEVKTNK